MKIGHVKDALFEPGRRRLLAGVVLAGALFSLLVIKQGYVYHTKAIDETVSALELYSDISLAVARAENMPARIGEIEDSIRDLEKGLLPAETPAVGAAELEEAFRTLPSVKRTEVASSRALGPAGEGGYLRIPVEFNLRAGAGELKDILYEVRSSPLIMGVRSMRVRVSRDGERPLDATLVIEGAARKTGAAE